MAAAIALAACSSTEPPETEPDEDIIPQVEVPPAGGPKLVALRPGVVVRDRPSLAGQPLGFLRAGAQIARAAEPHSKKGCEGGWYPVRPRGFVCVGTDATIDVSSPTAQVLSPLGPDLAKPLPYRYARVDRSTAVVYANLPSAAEQVATEPKLRSRKKREPKRLGAGANDVPLDDERLPKGPPVLLPEAEGVGDDGYRTTESFFVFPGIDKPADPMAHGASLVSSDTPKTKLYNRHSGMAITTAFVWDTGEGARRFGLLPDGRVVPVDRLRPALGASWHGVDVRKIGLPIGFALRAGVCPYQLGHGKATRLEDEEFEPRQAIPLTGRFRTVSGVKYYFTRANNWVRHRDMIYVFRRNRVPDFATGEQKWLDISLANQTLVAYVGKTPQYVTLISSGEDRLGDPKTGPSTIQGTFRLLSKHVTAHIDDREVGQSYSVMDAPWVSVFAEGFAITGSYWLSRFGEAQSYHNVALAPVDAHWLWHWSDPQLPDGWHGVVVGEADSSTIVHVRK